jgi:hypothetical protein
MDSLQDDVDKWLKEYNEERVHSGKHCYGKTPWQTFQDAKHLAQMKMLDTLHEIGIVNEVMTVNSSSV